MDVMMNMTTEDVRVLRSHFQGRMNLEQFVSTLKQTLHDRIRSELDFVVGVVELFHTIDVNGDALLDWDEFAGYMMDAGQAKADFYFDDLQQRAKRYRHLPLPLRDDKTPMNNVRTCVQQVRHLQEQSALAYFERDSDVVYLYALHFDRNEAPRYLSTMRLHTAFQEHTVICIEYVAPKKLLIVSSMLHTGYVSTWGIADLHSPAMVHRVETNSPHEQLSWVPSLQCLLSAAVVFPAISKKTNKIDGYRPHAATHTTKLNQLVRWDVSGGSDASGCALVPTEFVLKERLKGVSSVATYKCINRTHIAIGCEDGVIVVIDAESWETVSSFDAHSNGVKMLCFSPLVECLASIGFHSYSDETTLHVSVWKKRGVAGRLAFETSLKHHDAPLELVEFVDSRRQLLSLDTSGTFKVYSSVLLTLTSEPWECLQSFQVDSGIAPHANRILSCFVVPESAASDAVLVTAGHRVTFYDLCEVKEREEVLYTNYCQSLNLLVGVTTTKLMFWRADTGKLWKTFEYSAMLNASSDLAAPVGASRSLNKSGELASSPSITAACIDDRERKVILGDDTGSIKVVNAVNGNVMKELDPHVQAIASVSYVLHGKRVVSVSVDSSLHIYDENNALGYYVPFGAVHPQSVLLHSLRFLPEALPIPNLPLSRHRSHQQLKQRRHLRRTKHRGGDLEDNDSGLNATRDPQPERFEILKSVGNLALDRVAVLASGSRGESFVQVWSFDMSHTHGTCVAPLDDEITCMNFLGSSFDVIGGMASGRVLLWRASKDEPGYHCSVELQCVTESAELHGNNELRVAAIQHVFAVHASVAPEAPGASSSLSAITRRDHDAELGVDGSEETTDTFKLTDLASRHGELSRHQQPSQPEELQLHSDDSSDKQLDSRNDAKRDGVYVFAGDDVGFVTKWLVQYSSEGLEHHHIRSLVGSETSSEPGRSAGSSAAAADARAIPASVAENNTGTVLQHEEMVLGYEAIAALYKRAFDQVKRGVPAVAPPAAHNGVPLSPSRQRKPPSRLLQLPPAARWEAHSESILSLSYALDPPVVLSSSARGRIKVWSFGGESLGVLDDFASRRQPELQPWRFPLDMEERRRRKEQDAQQYLEKFRGLHRRGKQARLSVLQERLSLSHDDLAFDYTAEKKTQRHRHSRMPVRTSDVGRAIRKFVLSQASAPAVNRATSKRSSVSSKISMMRSDDSSRSLQVVLKEIDQLQLQTSARSGSAGTSSRRDGGALVASASLDTLPTATKKHYPRVTLADVKPLPSAFRPRSSSSTVHCELPQLHAKPKSDERLNPPPLASLDAKRAKEIVFTSASFVKRGAGVTSYALQVSDADARLTLHDLRVEADAADLASNQIAATPERTAARKQQHGSVASRGNDPVLTCHVKLAHVWKHKY